MLLCVSGQSLSSITPHSILLRPRRGGDRSVQAATAGAQQQPPPTPPTPHAGTGGALPYSLCCCDDCRHQRAPHTPGGRHWSAWRARSAAAAASVHPPATRCNTARTPLVAARLLCKQAVHLRPPRQARHRPQPLHADARRDRGETKRVLGRLPLEKRNGERCREAVPGARGVHDLLRAERRLPHGLLPLAQLRGNSCAAGTRDHLPQRLSVRGGATKAAAEGTARQAGLDCAARTRSEPSEPSFTSTCFTPCRVHRNTVQSWPIAENNWATGRQAKTHAQPSRTWLCSFAAAAFTRSIDTSPPWLVGRPVRRACTRFQRALVKGG